MKLTALGILLMVSMLQAQDTIKSPMKNGRYSSTADSLRKSHQSGYDKDSVRRASGEKTPVVRSDSVSDSIPAATPKSKGNAPAMERSDTLYK